MEHEELLIKIARILENFNIEYFVTGGVAVALWGRLRSTLDIDMIVRIIELQVDSLAKALRKLSKVSYIDERAMKEAIQREGEFNFIDGETGVKVDCWVAKQDERTFMQMERKIAKNINGQKVYFISPEDLILSKIQWYKISQSSKHLEDAESIFKFSGDKLDRDYLKQWAEKLGISEILNKIVLKNSQTLL